MAEGNYQALYRKYRPRIFEDVKGQEVVVRTLRNQILKNRIGHAYLFTGSRGTGKTTAAKIFAKAINCENPKDGDPCLSCKSCASIADGSNMNVIEIDAASNNGVDSFRQIIDEVAYPPTYGRYKVYIIDEVHMLSTSAFNAFLKTLEEPPEYVVFILATTDPQKLPATILSRCQRFDFHRIPAEVIQERLMGVLKMENVPAEEEAVSFIARRAEGGMRDALSITDQCISAFTGQKLTVQNVLDILGTVDRTVYSEMLTSALHCNAGAMVQKLNDLLMDGKEIRQIIDDFTWYLRDVLLFKASGGASRTLDLTREGREELLRAAESVSEDQLMFYIELLSELANALRNAANRRILTEVALIRLCRPETEKDHLGALTSRVDALSLKIEETGGRLGDVEAALSGGRIEIKTDLGPGQNSGESRTHSQAEEELPTSIAPELFQRILGQWKATTNMMPDKGIGHIMAMNAEPWYNPSDPDTLYVRFNSGWWKAYRSNEDYEKTLSDVIAEKYKKRPKVRFIAPDEMPDGQKLRRVENMLSAGSTLEGEIEGIDFPVDVE